MLYERGEYFDKAASVYIRSKNWYENLLHFSFDFILNAQSEFSWLSILPPLAVDC